MTVEEAELEIDGYNDTQILDAQVTFAAEVGDELCASCERLTKIAHDSIEAMKKKQVAPNIKAMTFAQAWACGGLLMWVLAGLSVIALAGFAVVR